MMIAARSRSKDRPSRQLRNTYRDAIADHFKLSPANDLGVDDQWNISATGILRFENHARRQLQQIAYRKTLQRQIDAESARKNADLDPANVRDHGDNVFGKRSLIAHLYLCTRNSVK